MKATVPTARRTTLPARCYVDPGWFASEMERLFASRWICVGRAEALRARGDFFRRDVAGASVLVVNDGSGKPRAFHNVCRHRGTRLCNAAGGAFAGSIQCPYHGWTYDLQGRLIGAPQMEEVDGFVRDDYPLRGVACEVWDGHAFINLSEAPPSLAEQLRDLPRRFAPWTMADLRMVRRIEYDVAANWKLIVQNYNECLHCPIIHPLLNRMHHYLGADNVPTTERWGSRTGSRR
jgi:Rieske 2Fe-2S family protein